MAPSAAPISAPLIVCFFSLPIVEPAAAPRSAPASAPVPVCVAQLGRKQVSRTAVIRPHLRTENIVQTKCARIDILQSLTIAKSLSQLSIGGREMYGVHLREKH